MSKKKEILGNWGGKPQIVIWLTIKKIRKYWENKIFGGLAKKNRIKMKKKS